MDTTSGVEKHQTHWDLVGRQNTARSPTSKEKQNNQYSKNELGGHDERGATGALRPVYTKIPEDTLRNEKQ